MKTLKKILLIGIIVVVVLGILGAVFVGVFFDKIVKTGIETVAPTLTKTSVTVDGVHISPLSGAASVNGFVIGNPDGSYKSTNAISLGKAAVSVEAKSILSDKIVIHSIEVRDPEITLEGNPFGDNNLNKILDNVNAAAGGTSTNQTAATPAASGEKKGSKKMEVDDFVISGVKVHARISGLEGEPFTVTIPDIHFSNLGTGPDGITAAELTQKVLNEVISGSVKAVGDRAKDIMGKTAGNMLKGATNTAGKAVSGGTDAVKKGIDGLFGK